jgi:3-isopropylmalate dehydrogenase
MKIAVFAGDGIGPEVTAEAVRVLETLGLDGLELVEGDVGGAAYYKHGHPLPPQTLEIARASDAILFGAVGDFSCDHLERHLRPEQAILGLRKELGLFANLGIRTLDDGRRQGWDMMSYTDAEVRRIAHVGFKAAQGRRGKLCSVDKANVLETSQVWRDTVIEVAKEYPDVELSHMYVDNAAMQLVKHPGAFDVIVTGNLFGDILSDQASMCVGSIGLLASASLGESGFGLYEPIHGSAPDIAGQGKANPMATILSAAMLLRHSLGLEAPAGRIEAAVAKALADGVRGGDLGGSASTREIGDAVLARL